MENREVPILHKRLRSSAGDCPNGEWTSYLFRLQPEQTRNVSSVFSAASVAKRPLSSHPRMPIDHSTMKIESSALFMTSNHRLEESYTRLEKLEAWIGLASFT